MWPILILSGLGFGLYYYANRSIVSREGPQDTKCKLNGEEFEAAVKRIEAAVDPKKTFASTVMAAVGNPFAKKADLQRLADLIRLNGTQDSINVADCIEVAADKATN